MLWGRGRGGVGRRSPGCNPPTPPPTTGTPWPGERGYNADAHEASVPHTAQWRCSAAVIPPLNASSPGRSTPVAMNARNGDTPRTPPPPLVHAPPDAVTTAQ